jgi:hypothetical protein
VIADPVSPSDFNFFNQQRPGVSGGVGDCSETNAVAHTMCEKERHESL